MGRTCTRFSIVPLAWGCSLWRPFASVYHNNVIYFHCAVDGLKLDLLNQNSVVSFCVAVDVIVVPEGFSTLYSSVILSGRASEVFDCEKRDGLIALFGKYSAGYLEQGSKYLEMVWERTKVYRIDIEYCTGKGTLTSHPGQDLPTCPSEPSTQVSRRR